MNLVNFRLVLDYIKTHPDEYDQGQWGRHALYGNCTSAYCFAGHAFALFKNRQPIYQSEESEFRIPMDAMLFLEITDGDWLFNVKRTIEDFERVARGEIDEHGEPVL